ncbi:MAG TPA: nucleotidyltransferase [Pyrinomonadaceae bacterium]|nr:nucleotidyltransferase [Pyrinomonadaceae bacterium]
MRNELDILREVSERLESAGIAFMLTGSVAMSYYAQPRMTRDIDLVAALEETDVEAFVRLFKDDYYLDPQAVSRAVAHRSVFNLIHNDSVIKIDFIVLKADPYRQEEFARRQRIALGDFQTWIVSLEDLILSKLYWARGSRSELQLRDVRNLLASGCELEYLRRQAERLGVKELLKEVETTNEPGE